MKEIAAMAGWPLPDAFGLPVGSANVAALPETNQPKEQDGNSIDPTSFNQHQTTER